MITNDKMTKEERSLYIKSMNAKSTKKARVKEIISRYITDKEYRKKGFTKVLSMVITILCNESLCESMHGDSLQYRYEKLIALPYSERKLYKLGFSNYYIQPLLDEANINAFINSGSSDLKEYRFKVTKSEYVELLGFFKNDMYKFNQEVARRGYYIQ